jgi:signal transduction histidine kinase
MGVLGRPGNQSGYGYTRDEFLSMTIRDISLDAPRENRVPVSSKHGALNRHRHKSGEIRTVEVAANSIEFGGRPAKLALVLDMTERLVLEDQLKQAQKLESIGQLAAGIAHEINTPIQYIGDNTNFLAGAFRDVGVVLTLYRKAQSDPAAASEATRAAEETDLDYLLEESPRAIAQTLEGVNHVARIVKAMKVFAHPGTDEKVPIDLNHAIETVIAVARNEWKYTAEVVTNFAPDLPAVPGLAGELNQVFLNLLVNAAHAVQSIHSSEGCKGSITFTTRRIENLVEVRITDTGCGIPEAIRGRIFDPFFTTKPVVVIGA